MTHGKLRWLAMVVPLLLAACTAPEAGQPSVTVLASWTGVEEQRFRQVIDAFERETDITVNYQGTRALEQVLLADVQKGTPPDVAIVPSPGELQRFLDAGLLHPMGDQRPDEDYSSRWWSVLRLGTDLRYAVPVKADLKSIVWYHRSGPELAPQTWEDMLELAAEPGSWCMGMGAPPVSGWPGTDWIEDILLQQSGVEAYRLWAQGELSWQQDPVRRAWQAWRQIVGDPAAIGGTASALLTDFGDAGSGMLADPPRCSFDHAGSFVSSYHDSADLDFFWFPRFPDQPSRQQPIVTADLAVMVKASPEAAPTPEAVAFMNFLASERGQRIWPSQPGSGAYSVNLGAAGDEAASGDARITQALSYPSQICLDASDLMPAAMRNAFYRAVLEFVRDPDRMDEILAQLDQVQGELKNRGESWARFSCG
ncbi:ABC transporter substrate-binding protein [Saccharopolyspora sp. 5N708]|uniref:ABC transporter substrate-binding protein n=1 Tax=Saccharopolyspora sp. 5N708 TaxID=3457424 RepID=UPI003FD14535